MPRPTPRPTQHSMGIVVAVSLLLMAVAGGVWGATPARDRAVAVDAATPSTEPPAVDPESVDHEEPPGVTSVPEDAIDVAGEPSAAEVLADVAPAPAAALDLPAPTAVGAAADPGLLRRQRLQRALEQWLQEHPDVGSVGVAAARSGDDAFVWTGDVAVDEPDNIDAEAPFGILSVTKTFTEALVLREAAAGRIDLDAPMPALPDVAPVAEGEVITPRMLLQHASGLVNYMDAEGYDPSAPMTPAKAVSLSLGSPRTAPPGTATHYSNSNFHWLGLLLEHVSGRSFGDLVQELAATQGLTATALDPTGRPGWVGFASGGMRSTLAEVSQWGARLFTGGTVLPAEVLGEFVRVGPLGVGLGVWPVCPCTTAPDGAVDYTAIGQMVAHGGLLHYPDADIAVAVRFERVPGDVGTLTASLAGALVEAADSDPDSIRMRIE